MKIIKIESCLRTDDEGKYFEECPYVTEAPWMSSHKNAWRCGNMEGPVVVPLKGIHPDCPLEDE